MCNHDSFFSIDNLVEFGLGMAVARQMVNIFNQNLATTMSPADYSVQNVHVSINNQDVGPLNEDEICLLLRQHRICSQTLAWMPGMATWKPVDQIPEILKIIALTSPIRNKDEEYKI